MRPSQRLHGQAAWAVGKLLLACVHVLALTYEMQENRSRILEAAARVYALHGYRGATTRRIAEEAGVNEITVFRHFGTKSALLDCVAHECGISENVPPLSSKPSHPEHELTTWVEARMEYMRTMRQLILQAMSEMQERPYMGPCIGHEPVDASNQLRDYVVRLRRGGLLDTGSGTGLKPLELNAAVSMLMNATFIDAISRPMMPEMFPGPQSKAAGAYVRVFLRSIGFRPHQPVRPTRPVPDTTVARVSSRKAPNAPSQSTTE